jgi:hypothetical protein
VLEVIQLIDQALERALRGEIPLPQSVDVSFAVPDKRWGTAITKPTVNLFLWDVRRDKRSGHFGHREVRDENGRATLEVMDPDITFRYLVTTWAGDPGDEHQLLGSVLRMLLRTDVIAPDHLPEELAVLGDILVGVASGEGRPNDFWSSLDGQLKPGLEITLTCRVPLGRDVEMGPPIGELDLALSRRPVERPVEGE